MTLSWNSVGLDSVSFSGFCAAIELNGSIEYLDLSQNQVTIK
jgi:hypothetical protein